MSKLRAWLHLIRPANVVTSAADVTAGFLFAGGLWDALPQFLPIVLASMFFYAGGVVLNDVVDADRDAEHRPTRPIPSGAVSRKHAGRLAAALLAGAALICIAQTSPTSWVGLALLFCILAYDGLFKSTPFAPGWMGLCRSLNFLLGASAAGGSWDASIHLAVSIIWFYVTALTIFAGHESGGQARLTLVAGGLAMALAILSIALMQAVVATVFPAFLVLVALLIGLWFVHVRPAIVTGHPADVQRAVRIGVLMIVIIDASLVLATRGPWASLMVLGWLVPAYALSRYFRVS